MARLKKRIDGRLSRNFTVNGVRYYVYGHSKQDLDEKEYKKRSEIESGLMNRENPSLNSYYETWTENRRGSIKESTLHSQQCQFNVAATIRIDSAGKTFGEMKLTEIKTEDIREVQGKLLAAGRKTQTVNDNIAHLSHVFNVAVKERRLEYNPCTLVKPLKRIEEEARDTHHRALTHEETEAFLEAAAGSYYFNVFRMALYTGMRCGEIGALYNTDIQNGMIVVERTITRKTLGNYVVGDSAKTESGRRRIPVNETIMEIIESQKRQNALYDSVLDPGRIRPMKDLLFKAPEGGLLMSTPVNREIARICKAAGVEKFTLHAFRDTFATRAIESGIDASTLKELLGHKDISITLNLYTHVLNDTKRIAMNTIESGIKRISAPDQKSSNDQAFLTDLSIMQ